MGQARITVIRPSGWFGRFRRLSVLVDGNRVAVLRMGEIVDLDVAVGEHHVQVKMDWCTSTEVSVGLQAGDRLSFMCKSPGIWAAMKKMKTDPDAFFELVEVAE